MEEENYEKIYNETKKFYWSIRSIICPALNNEKIIFHGAGWRHLIFKYGRPRPISQQIERFDLFKNIYLIIKAGKIIKYDEEIQNNKKAKFWRLSFKVEDRKMVVVNRQLENGPKHFFSIMN